jgi:hypothetical protein
MGDFVKEHGMPNAVVSGGAAGADTMGEKWARSNNVKDIRIYKPDWRKYGKKAGILRNKDIINDATHVVAFPSVESKGTFHSIRLAKDQGKKVIEVLYDAPEQDAPDIKTPEDKIPETESEKPRDCKKQKL